MSTKSNQPHSNLFKTGIRRIILFLKKRPLVVVTIVSLALLGLIILGNYLRQPQAAQQSQKNAREVVVLRVGEPFQTTLSTQVEKQGVVTIYAQTSGIVRQVTATEGKTINQGATIVKLASNYQGGVAQSTQRQIVEKQAAFDADNHALRLDTVRKQQEIARQSMQYTEELKTITQQSLNDTKALLTLNEDILAKLERDVLTEVLASSDPTNDDDVYAAKKSQASYQATVNQLKAQIRANELQIDTSKPDYQLSELQRDAALKQLELQEKALLVNNDISKLSLRLAQISESLMYPAAPWTGTVEKIFVKPGQLVSPGTPIAVIRGKKITTELTAFVGREVARWAATASGSAVIADIQLPVTTQHVSQEAVDGGMFSLRLALPASASSLVSNGEYVMVTLQSQLPDDEESDWWWLPLESVVQLQNKSLVYIVENEQVVGVPVATGMVSGEFVAVKGVVKNMQIIQTAQEVVAGDKVRVVTE